MPTFLLFFLFFFPVFLPLTFAQDVTDSGFEENLAEDPLTETEAESGLEEDPLSGESSGEELGLEEDPLSGESSGEELGLEEEPFAETTPEIDVDELTSSGLDGTPENQTPAEKEDYFQPKIIFKHEVSTMLGGSETRGLFLLDPQLDVLKEYRFVTTYEQSVRVQTSPKMYNRYRLSISFAQNYEVNKKRFFDGYASLREIYSNYRSGAHQLRYGTQIFSLGRVDLDQVVDVLHLNNIMALYTFEPDESKTALTALKYNWFRGVHTATAYLAPIRQQTFGMKFTELREEVEQQEKSEQQENTSFFRDYFGLQYQWTGELLDTRIGWFHWFDANPKITFEYQRQTDNGSDTLQNSFEKMLSSYSEQEARTDFITLEMDAVWGEMVWKLDVGIFKERNLYSYEFPDAGHLRFSTVRAPHTAWATSLERTFPYFYWLMIFSQRKSFDVPANSHLFLSENESALIPRKRNVERNQASGIAVFKTPDNDLRVTLLNYQTWPFVQRGFAMLLTWEQFKQNLELELKYFRLQTEKQKMLGSKIKTNQLFLTYTQKFSGN